MRFFSNIIFFSLLFTFIHAATFEIQNSCPYTVWAAAIPGGGRQLDVGQTWMLDIKPGTTKGRIWARTNCTFDSNGDGICLTGDCNGLLECQDFSQRYFIPDTATRVEYALNLSDNRDFMDITLVGGFNIPIELIGCQRIRCTADITRECPDVLRSVGGCNNPCTVFKTDEYCCNSGECGPTNYSRFFKERCPDAYSYPKDDATSTFTCPGGTNYVVQFCPLDFYFYFDC